MTGPQPRPLTLSLSPRPRPAITLSLFSCVTSPQPARSPQTQTLSPCLSHSVLSRVCLLLSRGPLSQDSVTWSLSVLSECGFPARIPSSRDRVRLSVTQPCQNVTSHPESPQRRPSHLASQIQTPQAETPPHLVCHTVLSQPASPQPRPRQAVGLTGSCQSVTSPQPVPSARSPCRHTRSPQAARDPIPQRSAPGLFFRVPPAGRVARGDSDLRRRLGGCCASVRRTRPERPRRLPL